MLKKVLLAAVVCFAFGCSSAQAQDLALELRVREQPVVAGRPGLDPVDQPSRAELGRGVLPTLPSPDADLDRQLMVDGGEGDDLEPRTEDAHVRHEERTLRANRQRGKRHEIGDLAVGRPRLPSELLGSGTTSAR